MPFNSLMTVFLQGNDIDRLIQPMFVHIKTQVENLRMSVITLSAYRCSVDSVDGTLKELARSKTKNVEKTTTFYQCIRSIIRHFQCSVKNKEILNTCLEFKNWGRSIYCFGVVQGWPIFWMHTMFWRTCLLLCMMQCLPSLYERRNVIHFFYLNIFLCSSSWLMFRNLSKVDTFEKLKNQMPWYHVFIVLIPHH